MLRRATPLDAVSLLRIASGTRLRERLDEITQPTLVIHGVLDVVVPIESSEYLASALSKAEFLRIEDAGHVPTVTRPDVVAEAIARFLAAHG